MPRGMCAKSTRINTSVFLMQASRLHSRMLEACKGGFHRCNDPWISSKISLRCAQQTISTTPGCGSILFKQHWICKLHFSLGEGGKQNIQAKSAPPMHGCLCGFLFGLYLPFQAPEWGPSLFSSPDLGVPSMSILSRDPILSSKPGFSKERWLKRRKRTQPLEPEFSIGSPKKTGNHGF